MARTRTDIKLATKNELEQTLSAFKKNREYLIIELKSYQTRENTLSIAAMLETHLIGYLMRMSCTHKKIAHSLLVFTQTLFQFYMNQNTAPTDNVRIQLIEKTYETYCAARKANSTTLAPALLSILSCALKRDKKPADSQTIDDIMKKVSSLNAKHIKANRLIAKLAFLENKEDIVKANLKILYTTEKSKEEIIHELYKIVPLAQKHSYLSFIIPIIDSAKVDTLENLIKQLNDFYLIIRGKKQDFELEREVAKILASALNLVACSKTLSSGEPRLFYSSPFESLKKYYEDALKEAYPIDAIIRKRELLKEAIRSPEKFNLIFDEVVESKREEVHDNKPSPSPQATVEENKEDKSDSIVLNRVVASADDVKKDPSDAPPTVQQEEMPLVESSQPGAAAQGTPRRRKTIYGDQILSWHSPAKPWGETEERLTELQETFRRRLNK